MPDDVSAPFLPINHTDSSLQPGWAIHSPSKTYSSTSNQSVIDGLISNYIYARRLWKKMWNGWLHDAVSASSVIIMLFNYFSPFFSICSCSRFCSCLPSHCDCTARPSLKHFLGSLEGYRSYRVCIPVRCLFFFVLSEKDGPLSGATKSKVMFQTKLLLLLLLLVVSVRFL